MTLASRLHAFLAVLAVLVWISSARADIPGSKISEDRISELSELTMEVATALKSMDEQIVVPEVGKRYREAHPDFIKPTGKLRKNQHAVEWAGKAIAAKLDELIPLPSEAEQQQLAAEKYPIYKIGDRVKVTYRASATKNETVEGVITGLRYGNIQINNAQRFSVNDMRKVEGNEEEALKMDARKSEELRQQFIAEMLRDLEMKRAQWTAEHREEYLKMGEAAIGVENESLGYTNYNGLWLEPDDFLQEVVGDALVKAMGDSSRFAQNAQKENRENLGAAIQAQAMVETVTAVGVKANPRGEIERQEAEAFALAMAEEARLQADEERQMRADEEAAAAAAREAAAAAKAANERERLKAEGELEVIQEVENTGVREVIIIAIVVIVGLLLILVWYVIWKRKQEYNDVSGFFKGEGKLQKEFWDAQAADPDNFKYVAYLFPTMPEAAKALNQLSFIYQDSGGVLRCKKEIMFGCYPHQGKAVAFVGGQKLNYALWREASGVLPELPGAVYFKVSTEPIVSLELPNMDAIKEAGLDVMSLDVQDVRAEDGSFHRIYRYSARNAKDAMAFLENTDVSEEGIVVQVITDDGVTYSKDDMGIYMDTDGSVQEVGSEAAND